jgi:hypothetical protein
MKHYPIILFAAMVCLISACQSSASTNNPGAAVPQLTEAQLKQQLQEKECANPTQYLSGTMGYTPIFKGLLSLKVTGVKLKFKITNSATLATFKNISAHVKFKSKTGAVVIEKDVQLYDYVSPGGEINSTYELDITNQDYLDIASYDCSITGADCQ